MTRSEIEALVALVPWDAPYLQQLPPERESFLNSSRSSLIQTYVDALMDPRFGWKFVRTFVELQRTLPLSLTQPRQQLLWRAYHFETAATNDLLMTQALALDHPRNFFARNFVKAFLLAPDLSWVDMSQKLGLSVPLLQLYDQLFWNVHDRLAESLYIYHLIYPEGRRVELFPDYLRREHLGLLLMRAIRNHGVETAMALGGMASGFLNEFNCDEQSQRLEALFMGNGLLWARLGGLNQSNMPGIMHARSVIAASKQGGAEASRNADSLMGLGAVGSSSIGGAILATLAGCQTDLLQRHQAMSPQEASQDLFRIMNEDMRRAEAGCKLKLARPA